LGNQSIVVTPAGSQLTLPAKTVINVDSVSFYDAAYPGGSAISDVPPGGTIYLRAVVSDPFGSADITAATLDISDPTPTVVVSASVMTMVADSGAATKTFEYMYTVPGGPLGSWSVNLTGIEGYEGTVTHTNSGNFSVVLPASLTVFKSASSATAKAGDLITYTVVVSNSGPGIGYSVEVSDDLSPYTQFGLDSYGAGQAFQFIDGAAASGLSLGIPVYSNDNAASWIYPPASGGGGAPPGFDANVSDFRIPMIGSMNPGGSFTLQYRMRVE
jgi:uncharacterized repeat protein (TIGR01451 family)